MIVSYSLGPASPSFVQAVQWAVGQSPKELRPERFLDGNDLGGYAWLPFVGGPRRCPGASLVLLEMRVVLTILRNVRLARDRPEKPRIRGIITIVPGRGGRVVVAERLNQSLRAEIEVVAT
jgi:cytochrome P450